jgi:hypothetical protein
MKLLMMTILVFSFNAFGGEILECHQFNKDVLKKAVTEVSSSDEPFRFVENEAEASIFFAKFDVKKLHLPFEREMTLKYLKDCPKKDETPLCGNVFDSYNYFTAIIYGLKNYKWSSKTRYQARKNLYDFTQEVIRVRPDLLRLMITVNLIKDATQKKLLEGINLKEVDALLVDMDKESTKLSKTYKGMSPQIACLKRKKEGNLEFKILENYSKRLGIIIQKWTI